jgi:hypothetical protein
MSSIEGPSSKQPASPPVPPNFGLTQGQMDALFNEIYAPLKDWYFNQVPTATQLNSKLQTAQADLQDMLAKLSKTDPHYTDLENLNNSLIAIRSDLSRNNIQDAQKQIGKMLTLYTQNLADVLSDWQNANGSFDATPQTMLEMVDFEISEKHTDSAIDHLGTLIAFLKSQGQDTTSLKLALSYLQSGDPQKITLAQGMIEDQIENRLGG